MPSMILQSEQNAWPSLTDDKWNAMLAGKLDLRRLMLRGMHVSSIRYSLSLSYIAFSRILQKKSDRVMAEVNWL